MKIDPFQVIWKKNLYPTIVTGDEAIIYARYSKDDRDRVVDSIPNQIEMGKEALFKLGVPEDKILILKDLKTGSDFNRKEMIRLLYLLCTGRFKYLWFKALSRSVRDPYLGEHLFRLCEQIGVSLIPGIDSHYAEDKMMRGMILMRDAMRLQADKDASNSIALEKIRIGKPVTSPPFGYEPTYSYDEKGKKYPTGWKHNQSAPFVRMLFEDFLRHDINYCMQKFFLDAKPGERRKKINRLLRNPMYAGKGRDKRIDEDYYDFDVAYVPPLISWNLFEKVQKKLG